MSDKVDQDNPLCSKFDYDTIESINQKYQNDNFLALDKVNLYGVITYIAQPKQSATKQNFSTVFKLVDNTCKPEGKLLCIIFSDSSNTFGNNCELGDIIRFHRFKIQSYNNQPQGLATGICSWVLFKRNDVDFHFEASSNNPTIEEQDKIKVKELREWIQSNPEVYALRELNLVKTINDDASNLNSPNEKQLAFAAKSMNMQSSIQPAYIPLTNSGQVKPITFSQIKPEMFFDIVCQVCAICQVKGAKFLILWDGTKSKFAVHQENEFNFELTLSSAATSAANSEYENKVYFSKSNLEFIFQLYIFDEFVTQLETIEAGDYVLLKNARSTKPSNSTADMVLKLPGALLNGNIYGRCLKKITSYTMDSLNSTESNQISKEIISIIKFIDKKGKEFGVEFHSEAEFKSEFSKFSSDNLNDETMDEILTKFTKNTNVMQSTENNLVSTAKETVHFNNKILENDSKMKKMSEVDQLLEDQDEMYSTDDETEKISSDNKENANKTKTATFQTQFSSKSNQEKRSSTDIQIQSIDQNELPKNTEVHEITSHTNKISTMESQPELNNEIELHDLNAQQTKNFINGIFPNPKRLKKLDAQEISSDIFKLKKLIGLTYLVPYLTSSGLDECQAEKKVVKFIPYFTSLEYLAEEAKKHHYMKCKVTAKLFSYSIKSSPHIATVFVNCKKCNYINFTPFHLASIHQMATLSKIINEADKLQNDQEMTQNENNSIDDQEKMRRNGLNFNLDWLQTVLPVNLNTQIMHTQQTQQTFSANTQMPNSNCEIPIMMYECPRCLLIENDLNDDSASSDSSQSLSSSPPALLEYIYRFWFVLRDATSTLDPCLIEADVAERFLNFIPPEKFYTIQEKAHQVFKTIHDHFNKKFSFTIETYNLSSTSIDQNPKIDTANNNKKIGILYKIVDMDEIIQLNKKNP